MEKTNKTALTVAPPISLTAEHFRRLKKVPPAVEWLENLTNARTRRAYEKHATEFARILSLDHPEQFREVTRAHVIGKKGKGVRPLL